MGGGIILLSGCSDLGRPLRRRIVGRCPRPETKAQSGRGHVGSSSGLGEGSVTLQPRLQQPELELAFGCCQARGASEVPRMLASVGDEAVTDPWAEEEAESLSG